ncbi:hypothetical protein ACUHOO_000794 [Pseudomonas aeruginosa]|jgi:hypothetical protein|uniref:hypothetical protein n=1 Tax=Pseudomonas aeruginosa TaxID=287 RepID=UPI0003700A83|nr:hypothetical protein [Pseudomonas aeruginosa]EIU3316456.1 hypothetical protein [Pseudomonas aeruginosa]EIY2512153.1 hypothetical protein [Pseudomonas aeruginosa]EIY2820325.1 hypothetical protein [Pseudomonas aeruginosa]EKT8668883.1 hypothetical protein [Pseudomonas aeruginosa]EKU2957376.1 hypothetical protein [Pseudomonas aeruginosa]
MKGAADPRVARTIGEAAANGDGTFNGIRLLSWLSEVLHPGHGLSVEEVEELHQQVRQEQQNAG